MQGGRIEEIDFTRDSFEDVLARDKRYAANAYAYLMAVLGNIGPENRPIHIHDILDEFRIFAIEQYGVLALHVMNEWGLSEFGDVSEMIFNLVESKRLNRDDFEVPESYGYEYDFKSAFSDMYDCGGE